MNPNLYVNYLRHSKGKPSCPVSFNIHGVGCEASTQESGGSLPLSVTPVKAYIPLISPFILGRKGTLVGATGWDTVIKVVG